MREPSARRQRGSGAARNPQAVRAEQAAAKRFILHKRSSVRVCWSGTQAECLWVSKAGADDVHSATTSGHLQVAGLA